MSINPLNDISKVYVEQVSVASRARNAVADDRLDVEQEKTNASIDEAQKPNDGNLANNYPPYDKITRGDVIAGRLGKDEMGGKKKKSKGMEEGYSNWRHDLAEVMNDVEDNTQIKEKKNIKNKVKTSAMGGGIKLGEAIEEIGGTLIEMVEIDEKMNLATADMGEVIKDFQTSDAPQFKGKTKEERRKMALAAKLEAERQSNEELQPTTSQQFAAQRQLAMAQKKLTAADQIALQKKKKEMSQTQEEFVSEEDYDRMKDERMMRGGVGGNINYHKPTKSGDSKKVDPEQRKKVAQKALELVRQQTMSKYSKKSLM